MYGRVDGSVTGGEPVGMGGAVVSRMFLFPFPRAPTLFPYQFSTFGLCSDTNCVL